MNLPSESARRRLPDWVKTSLPKSTAYFELRSLVRSHGLNTVCESASCPNIGACWDAGTLTIMILGDSCSRACRFCDVPTGNLHPADESEPFAVAEVLSHLNLRYTVITSVDRDDLPDGGVGHWARTLTAVREKCPDLKIEALIPDFRADPAKIQAVCDARPDVLAHNLETVAELQAKVRPQSKYEWSLSALRFAAEQFALPTKSGLMLGMGETPQQIESALRDLASVGCQILTLGQYLQPTPNHLPVAEFISPQMFLHWQRVGEAIGFRHVESGPLVRSSYLADRQARSAGI
jgi:lipoic acid synthetase